MVELRSRAITMHARKIGRTNAVHWKGSFAQAATATPAHPFAWANSWLTTPSQASHGNSADLLQPNAFSQSQLLLRSFLPEALYKLCRRFLEAILPSLSIFCRPRYQPRCRKGVCQGAFDKRYILILIPFSICHTRKARQCI